MMPILMFRMHLTTLEGFDAAPKHHPSLAPNIDHSEHVCVCVQGPRLHMSMNFCVLVAFRTCVRLVCGYGSSECSPVPVWNPLCLTCSNSFDYYYNQSLHFNRRPNILYSAAAAVRTTYIHIHAGEYNVYIKPLVTRTYNVWIGWKTTNISISKCAFLQQIFVQQRQHKGNNRIHFCEPL
ncbi:hypothetical protein BS17DRAFT_414734 [Gyrodon lividus]|nr:hypothetical protein BS17DRAFT_414734 [Gyrodon lividus]